MNNRTSSPFLCLVHDDEDGDADEDLTIEDEINRQTSKEIKRKSCFSTTNLSSKRARVHVQMEPIVLDSDDSDDEQNQSDNFESFDWTRNLTRTNQTSSGLLSSFTSIPLISTNQTVVEFSNPSISEPSILPMPSPILSVHTTKSNSSSSSSSYHNSIPFSQSPSEMSSSNENQDFAAFHDSFVYRCNYCKFLTKTRSILLQHVLTHMFTCSYCSYFSYSNHRLHRHLLDEHPSEMQLDSRRKDRFELFYVRRHTNGNFSLISDNSSSNNDLIKSTKHFDTNRYKFLKHRKHYLTKGRIENDSNAIENSSNQSTGSFLNDSFSTVPRLTEAVAQCIKSLVNSIVSNEENRGQPKLFFKLPTSIFQRVFSDVDIELILNFVKLRNKHEQSTMKSKKSSSVSSIGFNSILLSLDENPNHQQIFDSMWLQTEINKLPSALDNTKLFFEDRTISYWKKRNFSHGILRDESSKWSTNDFSQIYLPQQTVNEKAICSSSGNFSPLQNVIVLD